MCQFMVYSHVILFRRRQLTPVSVLLTAVASYYLVPALVHDSNWLINSRSHRGRVATSYALHTRVSDASKLTCAAISFHGLTRECAGGNAVQCSV